LSGFLADVRLDEMESEFRSQIEDVLAASLHPTHLDWHSIRIADQPDVFEVILRLARAYGLAVRIAGLAWSKELQSQGLPTMDYEVLDSYLLVPASKAARYVEQLRALAPGLSEWAVHPGLDSPELAALEPGGKHIRQTDANFFTSQVAREVVQEEGIILLDYRAHSSCGKESELEANTVMTRQSLTGAWQFRQSGTELWLPATVPGGAHTDLLALGLIPDPFVGDNERRVQWVAESDWEYRRTFAAPPGLLQQPEVWLVCDGLDTLATVTLNGRELGRTDNMFRQYRWDVKQLLVPDANELRIEFASAVGYVAARQAECELPGVSQAIPGGPHLRKAPCQFGWDWGPQLPPVGIWKEIRLEGYGIARLADVHLRQHHEAGAFRLEAVLAVQGQAAGLTARLLVRDPGGVAHEANSPLGAALSSIALVITDPKLWWPNGMGDQPLYDVTVQLLSGVDVLDDKSFSVGLRTIELRQEPDEWGRSFAFAVNGRPFFAKGANWIPADSFPTRLTAARLETLIRAAADTHQNMLRVWAGGFYEDEDLYDLCDRYGIMVWQDFIFSCSIYPLDDPAFVENIRVEAIENIRRLRHRASLALWCGNNEMEWGWHDWGWNRPDLQDLKAAYDRFFHHTLPEWVTAEDPDHAYWPSSPSSDTPFVDPNGHIQGDAHYWDVWHGRKPFTAYRDQYPRFMSEFGFQALPPMETIRTYAAEPDWNMTSYVMEQHQKNASGNALIVGQMLDTFRLPNDFESLVYLSMVLQAEGIRYGVEHWRRHTDRVAGALFWQLNDCWPVASWSSLDYFGRWKALHYTARRFFAPLLLSIEDAPPRQSIFVSSDLNLPWAGTVRWSLMTLQGTVLDEGRRDVVVAPSGVTPMPSLDFSRFLDEDSRRNLAFVAELRQGDARLAQQVAYFVPTKHLALAGPRITAQLSLEDGMLAIDLSAASLARLVELSFTGTDVVFSDNYFDLPAGRATRITAPLPVGWDLAHARTAITVRSVYDTFAQ
jgi:beta-mannosidase